MIQGGEAEIFGVDLKGCAEAGARFVDVGSVNAGDDGFGVVEEIAFEGVDGALLGDAGEVALGGCPGGHVDAVADGGELVFLVFAEEVFELFEGRVGRVEGVVGGVVRCVAEGVCSWV